MFTEEFNRLINQTREGETINSKNARFEGKEKNYVSEFQLQQFAVHARKDLLSNQVFGRNDVYPWHIIANLSDRSLFLFTMLYKKMYDSEFISELRDAHFSNNAKSKQIILARIDRLYATGRWDDLYDQFYNNN